MAAAPPTSSKNFRRFMDIRTPNKASYRRYTRLIAAPLLRVGLPHQPMSQLGQNPNASQMLACQLSPAADKPPHGLYSAMCYNPASRVATGSCSIYPRIAHPHGEGHAHETRSEERR